MKLFYRNWDKPGKGIDRNAPKKKGLARIWEMIWIEKWPLFVVGLMYLLFCLPIVTIPAATAAMVRIMIHMVDDEPRFLWSDYIKAFKENFKGATLVGWGLFLVSGVLVYAFLIYRTVLKEYPILYVPAIIVITAVLALKLMSYYIYPMLVRTELPYKAVIKNSFLLLFVEKNGLKGIAVLLAEFAVFIRLYSILIKN